MEGCYRFSIALIFYSAIFSSTISQSGRSLNDQPRIRTQDGVLIFEAGGSGSGTISFTASAIKVGQDDLIQTIDAARRIPDISNRLDVIMSSMGLHNDSFGNGSVSSDAVVYKETGNFSQMVQENSRKLNRLQRKLNRLDARVDVALTMLARDECQSSPCKNGATCIDKYNGFTCLCDRGWEGLTCELDKNECDLVNGTDLECKNGGTCINTRGSYRCQCPPAWHGIHCTSQKDDCTGSSNTELCGHGTCLTLPRTSHNESSFSCLCDAGWTKNGSANAPCDIDINECTVSKPPCSTDPVVNCINTPGSFRCESCPSGYSGNGIVCIDINECLSNNGGCSRDPLVPCFNTIGSYYCGACPYGYMGDGTTCTPFGNNCLINNGGCSPNALCTHSYLWNNVMCTCRLGYTGSAIGPFGCQRVFPTISACDNFPCQNGALCYENTTFTAQLHNARDYWCDCIPPWTGKNCDSYQISCGGNLTGPVGRFSSPPEPTSPEQTSIGTSEGHAHNMDCRWEITVEPHEVVWLKFLTFQLEHQAQCNYDHVEIIDPAVNSDKNGSLGRLCGQNVPQSFTSTSNKMIVLFHSDSSISYGGFIAMYTAIEASKVCGGELRQSAGTIRSPGYPEDYPAMSSCTWVIAADEGHQIILNITQFDLEAHDECQADYLEIRNGGSENSPLINRICGAKQSMQIKSHTNRLFLRFISDRFRSASGFSANYYTTATGCNGIMRAPFGAITSPNYPSPYNHNTECYWHIHAAAGSYIQATIVDFDLENSISCKYDYLSFFDGSTTTSPILENFCGTLIPQKQITTTSNEMNIKFRSDLSSHGRGFHLTYQSICQKRLLVQRSGVIESPGFPDAYPPDSKCDYKIEVPRGNKINVTFSHFGVPDTGECLADYLLIFDGDSESSPRAGLYCGTTLPPPFQSSSNYLYIKFVSDAATSGTGFRLEWVTHGCGGDILVERRDSTVARYITSPKFPNPYPPNTVCEWKLMSAEYGQGIKLDLLSIDMESHGTCRWDKLEIFNGPDSKSPPLTTVCHSQNDSQTMTSSSPFLYVRFLSDQSKAGSGFKARYSLMDSICGGNFSLPKGAIQSQNYPQNYDRNLACSWLITVAEQHIVILNITALNIDFEPRCETEYLAVYDGEGTAAATLYKDCGPDRITSGSGVILRSTSNTLFLEFRSNDIQELARTGFRVEYTTGCGAVLTATSSAAEFISPNFPSRYARGLNCSYVIKSQEPNTKVYLQFLFMDIEERSNCTAADYLQIRNGDNANSPLIGNFCGRKIPPAILSSGNSLHVRFVTNEWKEEAGWRATYSNTLTSCGGELSSLEGHFVSPNYPENYAPDVECIWTIRASPGNTIDLNFQSFSLGDEDEDSFCNLDYVEIREESASGAVLGRFCGSEIPTNITSGVGTLWVMFRSSDDESHPGFLAEYKLRHGGEITGKTSGQIASPLYPMNYPHNSSYTWRVTTTAGSTIKVKWLRMDMEDRRCYFDYVALYNGPNTIYPLIGKYCGFEIPEPIQTSSNQLFVVMNTDRYGGNGQGFLMAWETVSPLSAADRTTKTQNTTTFELRAIRTPKLIESPGYPLGLMPNQSYEWKLRTDDTSHIEVTMLNLNLGRRNEAPCLTTKPWLQITDGVTQRKGTTLICDVLDKPRVFKSTTNAMKLYLSTGQNFSEISTGFNLTYQSVCGANIFGSIGQIQSDGYPQPDANGTSVLCVWNITTDFGQTLDITFDGFELTDSEGCAKHNLTIRSGFGLDAPLLGPGPFCGSTIPSPLQTRSNRFEVRYQKDGSVTVPTRGFSLKYRVTRFACGGELRLTDFIRNGVFSTPNYPENYPAHIECEWIIVAPGGDRIRLDFAERFEIERPNNNACPWDYLEVRDGATPDALLIGIYCGTNRPGTLRSRSNVMYIKFRSDRGIVTAGFQANYSISTCGGTIVDQSGSITNPNYPQSYPVSGIYDCEWYLQVPAGHFIDFETRDFKLPQSSGDCSTGDFVEFRDTNATGNLIKRLCGTQPIMTFSSPDSTVYVRFKTTAAVTSQVTADTVNKFRILFNANSESCGGMLTASSGIITSPGFPNSYPNNRVCVWKIIGTPGKRVQLELLDFEVEGYGFCQNDAVEIFNGILPDSPRMERLCGSKLANTQKISSSMHYMTVRFHTDNSRTRRGFRLRYTSLEPAKCGGSLSGLSGVISSPGLNVSNFSGRYSDNEECIWTINNLAPIGSPSTINLRFIHLETESLTTPLSGSLVDNCQVDFVEIRAGKEATDPIVQRVCGKTAELETDTLAIPGQSVWLRFRTDYSSHLSGFMIVYNISACGGVKNDLSGWIMSPGPFPDPYPNNITCAWLVQSPKENAQIQFTLREMDMENSTKCTKDSLEILNGRFHTSPRIGEALCGNTSITPIRSQSSSLFVRFKSDSETTGRGFKASFMTITNGCGGTFHGNTGYIATPGYVDGKDYPLHTECIWDIIVDSGYHINLTFNGRFDIEQSDGCRDDYVELADPLAPVSWPLLARFCGHETPHNFSTTSNRLRVRFRSDSTTTSKGFKASWTIGCGGRLTDSEGVIVSPGFPNKPESNLDCRWQIIADPATPNIRLEFDPNNFDIEGSRRLMLKEVSSRSSIGYHMEVLCHDYIVVYGEKFNNETDAISRPARLCGTGSSEVPQPIFAQNNMTIMFHTDFALAGNGFKLTYKTQEKPFLATLPSSPRRISSLDGSIF